LIHGVSVGEVKGTLPLVRAFEEQHPEFEIVVCTTTSTGLEVARLLYPGREVVRFPLDLSVIVRRFLRSVDPTCIVLMELEIWPNLLRECNRAGVPVAVVNGRITPHSFGRYRVFRTTLPQFNRISLFCVQDESYAERFAALCGSSERVMVTGNVKADGLRVGRLEPKCELVTMLSGRAGQQVIVAGSTHHPEESIVTQCWLGGAPETRLILVPRHPQRASEVVRSLASQGVSVQLLTALRAGERPDPTKPVLVDTIGELEFVYALADLVFIGGTLIPHGGQNVLEPAAQGRAVIYGPHVDNFRQEVALLEGAGASRMVAGSRELEHAFRSLCGDSALRSRMGEAGLRVVEQQKGATQLTLRALSSLS
jgi:3-deoxy-D-manno-octulosonic-acid transferase